MPISDSDQGSEMGIPSGNIPVGNLGIPGISHLDKFAGKWETGIIRIIAVNSVAHPLTAYQGFLYHYSIHINIYIYQI
jgi:hypothetical protein